MSVAQMVIYRTHSNRLFPTFIGYCLYSWTDVLFLTVILSTINGASQVSEHWASVDDVATHLGVAKDSVYRWIEKRGLPAHKIGRLWKFKISEVDEWVRAGGAETQEEERDT